MPKAERKDRARRLREKGDEHLQAYLKSRIGRTERVLLEKDGEGRTEGFAPVAVAGNPGDLLDVIITGTDGHALTARPLAECAA